MALLWWLLIGIAIVAGCTRTELPDAAPAWRGPAHLPPPGSSQAADGRLQIPPGQLARPGQRPPYGLPLELHIDPPPVPEEIARPSEPIAPRPLPGETALRPQTPARR